VGLGDPLRAVDIRKTNACTMACPDALDESIRAYGRA